MFRRRRSVRPSSNSLTPNIPPALRRANQLIASKDYTEAAQAFEGLARIAIARDGPRAPLMLLQAGRMRILAGQVPLGMTYLQRGLELFAARGQWQRFHNSAQRLAAELSEHGLTGQADQIVAILNSNLPAGFVARPGAGLEKLDRILPANCPGCGAPLHADEVNWSEEITAECPYCGNAVRSE